MNKKYLVSIFSITLILLALVVGRVVMAGTTPEDPTGGTGAHGDGTSPFVSMSTPVNNSTVAGTVNVSANATDNVGVVSVQFMLDGANLGSADTSSPWSTLWDTTSVANGTYALTAQAKDAAGNVSSVTCPVMCPVVVTVSNATGGSTTPPPPPQNSNNENTNTILQPVTPNDAGAISCVSCKSTDGKDGVQVGNSCNTAFQCFNASTSGTDQTKGSRTTANFSGEWLCPTNCPIAIDLNYGSTRKTDILTLQRVLNRDCFLETKYVTGIYGPRTLQAVKDFQIAKGIPVTGMVSGATLAKVNELLLQYLPGGQVLSQGIVKVTPKPGIAAGLSVGATMTCPTDCDINTLQTLLSELGLLDAGNVTGHFGTLTLQAVKDFQEANGLPITGYVGSLTTAKINAILAVGEADTSLYKARAGVNRSGNTLPQGQVRVNRLGTTALQYGTTMNCPTDCDIVTLQNVLIELGYMDGQYNTGSFRGITEAAVKAFQTDNGIPPTGVVSGDTAAKINIIIDVMNSGGDTSSYKARAGVSRSGNTLLPARAGVNFSGDVNALPQGQVKVNVFGEWLCPLDCPIFGNISFGSVAKSNVQTLQKVLSAEGFLDTKYITGAFGIITLNAVKAFQAANGILTNGVVGGETLKKVNDLVDFGLYGGCGPTTPRGKARAGVS